MICQQNSKIGGSNRLKQNSEALLGNFIGFTGNFNQRVSLKAKILNFSKIKILENKNFIRLSFTKLN